MTRSEVATLAKQLVAMLLENRNRPARPAFPAASVFIRVHLWLKLIPFLADVVGFSSEYLATDRAQMDTDENILNGITEQIIGLAYKVASKLGCGFLEKCYENRLAYELRRAGFEVQQQTPLKVWYDGIVVGEFVADLVVSGSVLVELKAIQGLDTIHSAQCINYLAATRLPLCLLINFGKRVTVKRLVGSTFHPSSPS